MKSNSYLFLILFFCAGAITLFAQPINQKAQMLSAQSVEVSGSLEHRIMIGALMDVHEANPEFLKGKLIVALSPFFQFRVGATKWMEYQFRVGNRFQFLCDIYHFSDLENGFGIDVNREFFFENYLKFCLLDTFKANIAILPQLGVYFGTEGNQRICVAPSYLGISMGVTAVFDARVSTAYPDNRFYWGIPIKLRYNLLDINEFAVKDGELQIPEVGYGTIRRSFPFGELGLSFGRQVQERRLLVRHEVFFLYGFCNYTQFQGTLGKNIMSATWDNIYTEHIFTIGYNVSFGAEIMH